MQNFLWQLNVPVARPIDLSQMNFLSNSSDFEIFRSWQRIVYKPEVIEQRDHWKICSLKWNNKRDSGRFSATDQRGVRIFDKAFLNVFHDDLVRV